MWRTADGTSEDGKSLGDIEQAANAGGAEVAGGVLAGVIDEVRERVVAGVDGPNNFVERSNGLARGGRHFFDAFIGLFFFREVTEDSD